MCLLCLFFIPLHPQLTADTEAPSSVRTIHIGILAKQGADICLQRWNPTAEYLDQKLPDYDFAIRPLTFDEIQSAVELEEIDFILANPAYYVSIADRYNVQRIATLQNYVNGKPSIEFGSVIFTRSDNEDIKTIDDLRGKRFMAVEEHSFGGWLMALREFRNAGIKPHKDFAELSFGGTHDRVAFTVLMGKVDAGTVRSDTLERLEQSGQLSLKDIKILTIHEVPGSLPFLSSTRVYPEWPFAKLSNTPDILAKKVTVALLEMPRESPAAQAAHIFGWTVPAQYGAVKACLDELGISLFSDTRPKETQSSNYTFNYLLLILTAAFFLISIISLLFNYKYRSGLILMKERSNKEIDERRHVEQLLRESNTQKETCVLTHQNEMAVMEERLKESNRQISELSQENKRVIEEKKTLLMEVHHRVRNNLQLVLSIMNLQKGRLTDAYDSFDVFACLDDFEKRIQAISMTHEFIYQSDDLRNIQIDVYIATLISYLKSFVGMDRDISFQLDIEPLFLGSNMTTTLGLIVNEAVSNSIKYAFPENKSGLVEIKFHRRDDGSYLFLIRDNGVGFPENIDEKIAEGSLGVSLIDHLAQQISGRVHRHNNHGAEYRIIFS